jgi:hypothetical protein
MLLLAVLLQDVVLEAEQGGPTGLAALLAAAKKASRQVGAQHAISSCCIALLCC